MLPPCWWWWWWWWCVLTCPEGGDGEEREGGGATPVQVYSQSVGWWLSAGSYSELATSRHPARYPGGHTAIIIQQSARQTDDRQCWPVKYLEMSTQRERERRETVKISRQTIDCIWCLMLVPRYHLSGWFKNSPAGDTSALSCQWQQLVLLFYKSTSQIWGVRVRSDFSPF